MDAKTSNEIIDALGGTVAVARLCEVQPPSVSEWRQNGIPRARLLFLKAVKGNVLCRFIDPAPPSNLDD